MIIDTYYSLIKYKDERKGNKRHANGYAFL